MRTWLLAVMLLTVGLAGCGTESRDGDGLDTEMEVNGWTVRVEHADGQVRSYTVTSDPQEADTDGDGLDDFQEFQVGSDPQKLDTDGDRLLDGPMICQPDDDLRAELVALDIITHPNKPQCYLGESRWELEDSVIRTEANKANTDSNPTIGDDLDDGEEIEGWDVTLGARTYHVWSNPSQRSTDTDSDGLHDGAEKRLGTDPKVKDTDGDGVGDPKDAAPLGNLVVTVLLDSITLKEDYKALGGADLRVEIYVGDLQRTVGPKSIDRGNNNLDETRRIDVDDTATSFDQDGAGAGSWSAEVTMAFFHQKSGDDDPIRVKGGGQNQHVLRMTYDAFDDAWTGDASGGTSSGPDADVTIGLSSTVDAPSTSS